MFVLVQCKVARDVHTKAERWVLVNISCSGLYYVKVEAKKKKLPSCPSTGCLLRIHA